MANDCFYLPTTHLFDTERGRKLKFTPAQLMEKFEEYIEYLKAHPVEVEKEYFSQNQAGKKAANRSREKYPQAPTITGFRIFIGASQSWWEEIEKGRHGAEFLYIKKKIRDYCFDQRRAGARVNVYNANIVARELGMADRVAQTGVNVTAVVGEKPRFDAKDLPDDFLFALADKLQDAEHRRVMEERGEV